VNAARLSASSLGLKVDDAVVLHASNRVTVRLMPCDVVVRVAPEGYLTNAEFEVEVAQRLAETDSPVAALEPRVEPRVYARDGFIMNMWTYYEPVSSSEIAPAEYARALQRLHAGLREIDLPAPHFTDRIAEAQQLVGSRVHTPELADLDRAFLSDALRHLRQSIEHRGAADQLLHGEPHPGNLLNTRSGPLFIDFETVCRGPVEFDVAHVPDEVSEHYPGIDPELLRECRILVLAMVASWRWDREDRFPNGRQMGLEMLSQLRTALDRHGLDAHS
jgi:Ser/Thr protein kinase RdoA (MazF antagonist)